MGITYGDAEKFYSDLLDSKTPRSAKYLVYQTYAEAKERNELINEVLAAWDGNVHSVTLRKEVYTITNNLFIIEEDYPKNQDYSIVVKNEDGTIDFYTVNSKGKRVSVYTGLDVTLTDAELEDNGLFEEDSEHPEIRQDVFGVKVSKFRGINNKGQYAYEIHYKGHRDDGSVFT